MQKQLMQPASWDGKPFWEDGREGWREGLRERRNITGEGGVGNGNWKEVGRKGRERWYPFISNQPRLGLMNHVLVLMTQCTFQVIGSVGLLKLNSSLTFYAGKEYYVPVHSKEELRIMVGGNSYFNTQHMIERF